MSMKVLLDHNPLAPSNRAPIDFGAALRARPAWITAQQPPALPAVTAYRLQFDLAEAAWIRVHVSADERYLFYVDGQVVGRGPERGSDRASFYESYDLTLAAAAHTLVALVWQLGEIAPLAQVGLAPGFLLEAEGAYGALLATKSAAGMCKPVAGISFEMTAGARQMAWFVEPIQTTDGEAYPWGIERGHGDGWQPVSARREGMSPTIYLKRTACWSSPQRCLRGWGCGSIWRRRVSAMPAKRSCCGRVCRQSIFEVRTLPATHLQYMRYFREAGQRVARGRAN